MLKYASFGIICVLFIGVGFFSFDYFEKTHEYLLLSEQIYKPTVINLVALDENEKGMFIPLTVEIRNGNGKVLVNIDDPSFILDTQQSMRTAVREANRITGKGLSDVDVVFSLDTKATLIGGPSAGSAMAIATCASLLNKKIKEDMAITGTIKDGGKIGKVGGIVEKAKAAKEAGVTTFLVPMGESVNSNPVEVCDSSYAENWNYEECLIHYENSSIANIVGINIIEVDNIEQALDLMLVNS